MSLAKFLRRYDSFGAYVSLNINGKKSENSVLGGMVTIGLRVLILVYLCICMIAVIDNTNSNISSYQIRENRQYMEEAVNFEDYHANFYFGFYNSAG